MREKKYLTKHILNEYDLDVNDIEKVGKVWKIDTDRGDKCLRLFEGSEERLVFIYQGLEHIAKKGFRNAIRFIRTKYGQPYIKHSTNQFYYLCDWFNGINIEFSNESEVSLAAECLAKFHLAAEGFNPKEGMNDNKGLNWHDWHLRLERRVNDLYQYKDIATKKLKKSRFDRNYLKYIDYYINQSIQAIKLLLKSKYLERKTEGDSKELLCHKDYREDNIILNDNNIVIVDFDNCVQDIKMYDFTRFIEGIMIKNRWNWDLARSAISTYGQINRLSEEDLLTAMALFCFPRRFWVIAKRYYRDSQNWEERVLTNNLKMVIKEEKNREEFLSKLNNYYRRSIKK